jgi:hypothetical protein
MADLTHSGMADHSFGACMDCDEPVTKRRALRCEACRARRQANLYARRQMTYATARRDENRAREKARLRAKRQDPKYWARELAANRVRKARARATRRALKQTVSNGVGNHEETVAKPENGNDGNHKETAGKLYGNQTGNQRGNRGNCPL